jgi:outer membrane protein insertion porin family/translocation and assembly module TamA
VRCFARLAGILAASITLLGCASIPKGTSQVGALEFEGNEEVSTAAIEAKIATTPTPRFLGVFRGVYEYSVYDRGVLQRDLERIERYYRARGFYQARARAARVVETSDDTVEIAIEVDEGPRTLVREVTITGMDGLSADEAAAVRSAMEETIEIGEPLEEEGFEGAETAMTRALTDAGFAWASVERKADVDLVRNVAHVSFALRPGPKAVFGRLHLQGLKELPANVVEDTIAIDPGDAYSTDRIDDARDALLALGTFGSVEISPSLPRPPPANHRVDLTVKVREAPLRSLLLGGGFQLDAIRAETHARVGWEDRNLFGGFRHFLVDLEPTLALYPTRVGDFQAPTTVLPGGRFRVSLRQPSFLEGRMAGVLVQQLKTYPVLLSVDVDPEAPVLGYLEYRGSVGVERSVWKAFFSPTYNFQYNLPFGYVGKLDEDLTPIAISYVDGIARLDLRDDRLRPHEGLFLQAALQFAGIGGDARDVRIQPEARGYIPLGSKVTIALRSTVGLLFPFNYGGASQAVARGASVAQVGRAEHIRDLQIVFLRGFFSGGPSSNRGYAFRSVGPHGIVPFYQPGESAEAIEAGCQAGSSSYEDGRCAVPVGGLTLWEASVELRFPIVEPLGAVVFCDTSDVSAEQATFRFGYLHLSCGGGLRYETPVGPVRLDVGYRIPGAQFPDGADPRLEGDPGDFFGAPIAVSVGLGEAF